MRLDKEGTQHRSYATQKAIMNKLAFILDNRLLQVATVNSQITSGVTALNRGDYSKQELENFKTTIETERLFADNATSEVTWYAANNGFYVTAAIEYLIDCGNSNQRYIGGKSLTGLQVYHPGFVILLSPQRKAPARYQQ